MTGEKTKEFSVPFHLVEWNTPLRALLRVRVSSWYLPRLDEQPVQLSCPLEVSFITYWWCLRTWYHAFYMKPKWFVSLADPWRELSSRFVPSDERNHSVTSHWSILSHRKQSSEISSTEWSATYSLRLASVDWTWSCLIVRWKVVKKECFRWMEWT